MQEAYLVYLLLLLSLVSMWSFLHRKPDLGHVSASAGADLVIVGSVLLYGLVLGLRYQVGGDYNGYVGYYSSFSEDMTSADVPYEWGFFALIKLLRALNLPPAALFVATCTIQMGFMASWMRRHRFIASWYIYFFFTSLLLFESLNTIRQALAYGVILAAMPALRHRQFIQYVVLVTFASLFHSSALFFVPLYFLLDRDWLQSRLLQICLLVLGYIIADYVKDILLEFLPVLTIWLGYGSYSKIQEALFFKTEVEGFSIGMLFLVITDIIIIVSSKMLKLRYAEFGFRIYYNLYLIGALFTPFVLYANYIPFGRLNFYFLAFKPVVLAFAAHGWWKESGRSLVWVLVIVSVIIAYLFWFNSAIFKQSAWCSPFQFVFQ